MSASGHDDNEPHYGDLEVKLRELGLDVQYWMPKLQEHLGVTSAQALQHLQPREILILKSHAKYPWEKRALENLPQVFSNLTSEEIQERWQVVVKERQERAYTALQELREMQVAGKSRQEEIVRSKEEELRQAMEIPPKYWPVSEKPLIEVIENMKRNLSLMEGTLSYRENLPDRELLRRVSGGLALQGIFQTNNTEDLLEKREDLISLPENFYLFSPEQGTRMETMEFLSSYEESVFTQSMEKLGFSVTFLAKGGGWGFNLETSTNYTDSSESRKIHKSHSEHTFSCTTKFNYIPLASCHFARDQLHLSRSALKELKKIEEFLNNFDGEEIQELLKQRCEAFFKRFGSHVNQGPLHLGGVFWWKAIAEGFKSEELHDVKEQASEVLDGYIAGSYSGFGVKAAATGNVSHSQSEAISYNTSSTNLQARFHLSVYQTGGPPEVESLPQWKAGLVASNHTWCVIDRGYQLVPVWDIILSNHQQDFKDPLQVTQYLTNIYTVLTGQCARINDGEVLLSAVEEAKSFVEEVKFWEIIEPEEKLQKLIDFMQHLNEKTSNYNIWINICLKKSGLQQFLVDIVNFYKDFPVHKTKFIKSQLHRLLYPHVYQVKDFPQSHSVMQWVFYSVKEQEDISVTEFTDFIQLLEKVKNELLEINHNSEFLEKLEEAQRKITYKISLSLSSFLSILKQAGDSGTHLLILSFAVAAGYREENQTFQCLLGCEELNFLLGEMKQAHEKYQYLNKECGYSAQAFLLFTGLTVTPRTTAVSTEEKEQRLNLMKSHMGQSWSKEVLHVLSKSSAGHDWKTLEEDLNFLIIGDYQATVNCIQMEQVKKELETVFQRKKKPCELDPNIIKQHEVIENSNFLDLAKRLGLDHYYPRKMSRTDFHLIYKASVHNTQPLSEQQLPFYFLQKLLMLDYRLRYLVCKDDGDTRTRGTLSLRDVEDDISDPYDDLFDDNEIPSLILSTDQSHIHPMDIQMMIFHCADDFMRQYISNKLSICQFALPLVVPNPYSLVIEFPLWSLSQIKKSWREVEKSDGEDSVINFNNQLICQVPIPIVSFIRVVNSTSSSKSQILNSLLSKHKHDAFFHRHCQGSSKFCLLMGGMIEISWFCPGGRDEDRFERAVAFTNLRGDAKDYELQLKFLQAIASVTVVLVSASDKSERTTKMVRDLWKSSKHLIYLFEDKDKTVDNDSGQKVRIGIRNRNEAELMAKLASAINRLLKASGPFLSLKDCAEFARRHGFLVDVDRKECQEAKEKAQTLMSLMKEMKLSEMKENLLPLQGELWHKWCKKDKELYHLQEKGNRSIEQHKSDIEKEKKIIRQTQLKRAFPLNDLMRSFLEILQSHSEKDSSTELYFLGWLSTFMDNLTRDHLEKLHKKYKQLCSLVMAENKKESKDGSLNFQQMKLEAVSKEIRDSSLGVEHLLREVGQIYEALEEYSLKRDTVFSLPQIAVDLMVSGYPLELMDGDASYVPLKWVAAVFDRLIEKIGDEKLFVLSALGLQSTGKSTLLNAMFGLQFNVSAGQCTRGAYMQLLKVEETLWEELGFAFVLVVDTEGLRAPELSNKSQNRDNELATFVIGLANLTVINIFGENPSEMQDILQIVVQAFLRMKQVNISPSCLFVHQNVGEITAKDQNMEGRRRLQQRLDEMAATAADQEQYSNISCFSDVIRFDVNTHVHYFAHLWEGDPPMAPPNPSYSHNIQELKRGILLAAKKESKAHILRISEVKVRIHDLWKALVNENFIFSFRNTREVMAMTKLETIYNHWTWNLRSHVLSLQNQLTNQIQNGEIQDLQRSSIETKVEEKYEVIRQELQKYFDEDQENEILIQWKGNFENKLRNLKAALVSEIIRMSNDFLSVRKRQRKLDKEKSQYEKKLLLRSRDLALSLMGKQISEVELREKFSQLWTKWVCEVSLSYFPAEEPKIDVDLENVFLEHFKQEPNVANKFQNYPKGQGFEIIYDKHVIMKKKFHIYRPSIADGDKKTIKLTTDNIILLVMKGIESTSRMGVDYNVSYFHEILQLIDKEIDSASNEADYIFTNEYKLNLSLFLFHKAAEKFKDIHKAFKNAHDPVTYLENKREDFFTAFKISCQGATSVTAFADFLWCKVTDSLPIAIWKKIAFDLAGEIMANCPSFNGNRSNLERHILISLLKEENFGNYHKYIHTPKEFFKNYIENEIQSYCTSGGNEKLKKSLHISLEFFKQVIFSAIYESSLVAKDQNNSASVWLDTLCNKLGCHLTLPRENLRSIEHQEINDIEFLKEVMNEHLDTRIQKVGETCKITILEEVVPKIHAMLSEHLSGCWNQCPMCKAICTNTVPNHSEDHSVFFHRSQAVNGWSWFESEEFAIDFCTSSVASDDDIIFNDGRRIPFKNYRQAGGEYAKWIITPDTSAQLYWKWFVCRFRSEMEKHYNLKFKGRGKIPDIWFNITKQDVLNDLNK